MTEHHNAMVFDAETIESPDGKDETKVQHFAMIFFLNVMM